MRRAADPSRDTTASGGGSNLVCSGVAVRVGGANILRDLDLRVRAGRLTALVGPSGAGKTTLLRAVAGLEPILDGTISLGGRDLAPMPSHRRRLAVVFQEPRLFPNLTVGDNVSFPLRMAGVGRQRRRRDAETILDEVGLPGIAGRGTRGLSGGEQQRVALARALAGEPELLLLDEPLSGVDPNRREELRQLIARLQRERAVTTVYVTHDRAETAELGDQVALMIEGHVVQHATPEELFTRPSSAVVARFFGATNILTGMVRAGMIEVAGASLPVDAPDGVHTVTVRPERLRLDPDGPLRGRCETASFQGSHLRIVVCCDGTRLEAHVDAEATVRPEERVGLAVAPQHLWVLPEPEQHAHVRNRGEAP